jgi:O-methyltransferase involved in polyketide biosynthesis
VLVFDYFYSRLLEAPGARGEIARMRRSARITGEALVFGIPEGTTAAFLQARGFTNVEDVTAAELQRRYFAATGRAVADGYAIVTADAG